MAWEKSTVPPRGQLESASLLPATFLWPVTDHLSCLNYNFSIHEMTSSLQVPSKWKLDSEDSGQCKVGDSSELLSQQADFPKSNSATCRSTSLSLCPAIGTRSIGFQYPFCLPWCFSGQVLTFFSFTAFLLSVCLCPVNLKARGKMRMESVCAPKGRCQLTFPRKKHKCSGC